MQCNLWKGAQTLLMCLLIPDVTCWKVRDAGNMSAHIAINQHINFGSVFFFLSLSCEETSHCVAVCFLVFGFFSLCKVGEIGLDEPVLALLLSLAAAVVFYQR